MTHRDRPGTSSPELPVDTDTPKAMPNVTLRTYAMAAAAMSIAGRREPVPESPEARFLLAQLAMVAQNGDTWTATLPSYLRKPARQDRLLLRLAEDLHLTTLEILAVTLAAAVEEDLMVGRVLAYLQAPVGGSRPTLGFLTSVFANASEGDARALEILVTGTAMRSGLMGFTDERPPLPERSISIPVPICMALSGYTSGWPGATMGIDTIPEVSLPPSIMRAAEKHAGALATSAQRTLVIRSPSLAEGRWVAATVTSALGRRPLFIEQEQLTGIGPFLKLQGLLPVFCCNLAPGERKTLPAIPYYQGPVLALCGPDGSIEASGGAALSWTLAVPPPEERRQLWQTALHNDALAADLAHNHRHGAGRIAHLGRLAQHQSALRGGEGTTREDVIAASWSSEGSDLDALAEPLTQPIPDEALVLSPTVKAELDLLLMRCHVRDGLAEGLGASVTARYRTGVRALLVGPSGTGKTLAAGWLATKLGIPLYRVDLSAVMSKYIGETEKNLAQLLSRAEQAEIMLLFDEADSFFGKRTDVKEANDRFANAQTNYLLQRIETFDGITLLTSNSRSRFDAAFTRRLDAIIEFSLPGPEERRALWLSHLGETHTLTQKEMNQIAATADVGGGHIRNAVLTAAVLAHHHGRPIQYGDLIEGLAVEYRKLGRLLPTDLGHR